MIVGLSDLDFKLLLGKAGHPEVTVTNGPSAVNVRLKVGPIPVSLSISLAACNRALPPLTAALKRNPAAMALYTIAQKTPRPGAVEINIISAKAAGLGFFGMIRSKVEQTISSMLADYGLVSRNDKGNVVFQTSHFDVLGITSTPVKLMVSLVLP